MPVIDGTQWMGGAIYVRNAIYCLASLPAERQPVVRLIGNVDPASDYVRELAGFRFVEAPRLEIGRTERVWSRLSGHLPKALGLGPKELRGIDLTFPTFGPPPPGATPLHWIPDFQHIALPQFFTPQERAQRDQGIRDIAEKPGLLVLSSEAAAADFRAFAPEARVDVAIWRFCTVLTANEEGGANPHQAHGLPERYIYLPNQFWAHKNHVVAFQALASLGARGIRPVLVCTGQEDDRRNPKHMPMLRTMLAEHGLQDQVRFLGLIPRADQIEVFRRASFVLQPSLFEGWSTVVEDAKALGRPILLSSLPVHREQVEEAGDDFESMLFDPHDAEGLAALIEAAWSRYPAGERPDDALRARQAAERRRTAAAERLLAIFHRARDGRG
jgi:glycosyltransferase involved in cell wall biosynthesis